MVLAIIVMVLLSAILYNRGYTLERIVPVVLLAGAVAFLIPIGALIAWPFKLIGSALGFAGSALGAVAGGVGGLLGGILSIVTGVISLILGLVGGVIGLVFGMVGLIIGIVFAIAVPLLIIWIVMKMVL